MKYTTRSLMLATTIAGVMAAMLRWPSPESVLALLLCVGALIISTSVAITRSFGPVRRMYSAAVIAAVAYLFLYVATDSLLEAVINHFCIAPFALMKGGPEWPASSELHTLSNTMEFHYFQQKMNLIFAVISGITAASLIRSFELALRNDP